MTICRCLQSYSNFNKLLTSFSKISEKRDPGELAEHMVIVGMSPSEELLFWIHSIEKNCFLGLREASEKAETLQQLRGPQAHKEVGGVAAEIQILLYKAIEECEERIGNA